MSPKVRAAHLRMLESLPRRTHEWRPIMREWGCKRTVQEERHLQDVLEQMQRDGKTRDQMRAHTGCTHRTILKLLGPAR